MINGPKDGISMVVKRRSAWIGAALIGLAFIPAIADDVKMALKPLKVGATLQFGQMFNIEDSLQEEPFNPTVTLPYTSLWMIQEAQVNERLYFNLGIAGSFFYPFPEDNKVGYTSYRLGGVAILTAMGAYSFGDMERPWLQVAVGQQGYKYNPYAKNFGEYLFRSEAYPTTVRTGDWGAIDNAGAGIWGIALKTDLLNGLLKNDLLLTMANERIPLNDVSLTNITTVSLGKVFQIGGGISLSRYLQIDPKKSKPVSPEMGWFEWSAADQARLDAYIQSKLATNPAFLDNNSTFEREIIQNGQLVKVRDTALVPGEYWAASGRPIVKFLANKPVDEAATSSSKYDEIDYVDAKTIFLMGRASFDPKPLLGLEDALHANDLVVYGEASIIGLTNYPVYYRKIQDRLPIMAGFYFPTFKTLDYLAVEVEYMRNPHVNSDYIPAFFREPRPKSPNGTQPAIPSIADPVYDAKTDQYNVNYTDDDFKWIVTAQKSFGVWNIAGQAGRDHFRPLNKYFRPTYTEAASTSDSWYYMLRLMVNL